ncbi:MAG TPA: aldehyde dehydrogenase [Acidimicrobiales bacterium]|nr:aldehyde dehydrogenase [Acidimicrobiales bacterium]
MTTGATSTGERRSRAPEWDALFIGGHWVSRAGSPGFEVVSPHDAQPVGRAPMATTDDVDLAVAGARHAFDVGPWSRLEPGARVEVLRRFADIYEARLEEMARLITAESGSPITFSRLAQAWAPWSLLDTTLDLASVVDWEEARAGPFGTTLVRREPVGVVAAIAPWNVPQMTIISKLAPALVAGCTIVVKPSPETPLDGLLMAEWIDEAGLPDGVVSVLPADREVGEHLVSHPGVDRVAFTGSTAAGRRIGAICGEQIKRVGLELGGKSAAIVLDDADLTETVAGLRFASFMNSGQACAAQTRVLVPRRRHDEIADALGEMARGLVVGDPLDDATEIGPMVSRRHQERVAGYIGVGTDEGARVVAGGPGVPDGLADGCYVRPTIFASVDNHMRIAREEIFGPVVVVVPYDTEDDAVRIANDSDYGLAGSVWTGDQPHGVEVARRIRTGTVGVNKYAPDLSSPFGGYKSSGIGREYGREGLEEYFELKSIAP